ncbi:hypothetical protein SAMN02745121_03626 [Nannocystis exedens]|uniref:Tetratricopeptide repeat-containing protein n=1 Tax=Nannocystis exedens TaxID=54 RepID=A0A1I1Z4L4_9BACT|nr:hypothetical protein [Nannocystis exedens]PCC75166.1 hypothetical protein NAEX_08272 [Nannocystis exedens]SFE26607.1 hypothetical protein SAMN02745121_03626 [Nannocystis exedens]
MRDPAHGSDFTPDELDLLEDALEWMEDPARRGDLEAMPAPLRQRADEYAAILAMTREAMPEEDVSPGLLDGILAEARRAAPPPASAAAEGPSLWERLRRSFLLPGVALAGTAALLLWVARPVDEAGPSIREEAAPSPAPAAPEAAREPRPVPEPGGLKDMSPPPDEREAEAPAEVAPTSAAADAASVPGAIEQEPPSPAMKAARGGAPAKKKAMELDEEPLPGLAVPEEQRVDADKESVRDQLESGDRARNKGRCDLAEAEYAAVANSNGPAAERARALAGLGLCREAAGKTADAERYFEAARSLDAGVERWLGGETEVVKKKAVKAAKPKADGL